MEGMEAGPGRLTGGKGRPGPRVRRKVFHLFLGTALILLFITDRGLRWPMYLILLLGLALSSVQERWPWGPLKWVLDRYDKEGDRVPGQGPITFFLGCLVAWSIFPYEAALAAMVVLTFGDPAAYLVGTLMGRHPLPWNRRKTWAGMAAYMLAPACILVPLMGPAPGLLLTLTGALIESLPFPNKLLLDDNVTVPIATGAAGALMLALT